jgi:hypothetical protein
MPPNRPKEIFINPTGTYDLKSDTKKKDGDIYGYFGTVKVKLLQNSRIAMSFYICKGAPSYNSGSFVDTLNYHDNKVIRIAEDDPSCKLVFTFSKKEITVVQQQKDLNFGCGFGHGVFADGSYKKISSKIPLIEDQLLGQ